MLDNSKMQQMILTKYKSVAAFCRDAEIPYTTMKTSLSTPERLGKMPIDNFLKVAKLLGITPEDLYEHCLIEVDDD